ncbi:MAG: hypothetical protein WCE99_08170, partial [Nitrososphaeraceae archaeon]
ANWEIFFFFSFRATGEIIDDVFITPTLARSIHTYRLLGYLIMSNMIHTPPSPCSYQCFLVGFTNNMVKLFCLDIRR